MGLPFIGFSLLLSGIVYFIAYLVAGFTVDFSFFLYNGVFTYFVLSLAWLAAVIVSAIIIARKGEGSIWLTISCMMLIATLLSFPVAYPLMKAWLGLGGYSGSYIANVLSKAGAYTIIGGWVGLAGIICLIRAFWIKSKVTNES